MKLNSNKSIVNKIRRSIFATSLVAVVISGILIITSEYFLFRDNLAKNVTSVAEVIAFNVIAPLVFDNVKEAERTLQSLSAVPGIQQGLIIDERGNVFAQFSKNVSRDLLPILQKSIPALAIQTEPVLQITSEGLFLTKAIEFDAEVIGFLAISAGLDDIYSRLQFQSIILFLVLCFAMAVAFFSGSRMQSVITTPLAQLSKAMQEVSESSRYETRIEHHNSDEIGVLVDGFNNMLEQIHDRDCQLATANDELEAEVQVRTRELESTNLELTKSLSEVAEAKDRAEAANRSKSAFLATMSHEIRTPINGFLGNTELLLNERLGDKAREFGEIAYRSGEALLDIINDILDFSRIEAGKLEFNERAFPLARVVEELCTSLAPVIRQKQLTLNVNLHNAPDEWVIGDQGRIRQVISNLIANAMKFTEVGSISVNVSTREIDETNLYVRVEVKDTGIGIAPDQIDCVFDRFEQIDNSFERVVGGTGLGLTICKELVTRMGGTIGVESELNRGSMFWFEFPLSISHQHSFSTSTSDSSHLGDFKDEPLCKALVVDDSVINRDMATNMLKQIGAAVQIAKNGREAIELVTNNAYDLILMDCQMPEIDGFRATRRIRALEDELDRRPAHIVALTANAIKGDRERCLQSGMSDYLAKPFKMEELRKQVRAAHDLRLVHQEHGTSKTALDQTALQNIRRLETDGAPGLMSRYVGIYMQAVPDLLGAISEGISRADAQALTFAAHSLKSESAPLGATRLSEIAHTLEVKGRSGSFDGTNNLLDEAKAEFLLVEEALIQEMNNTETSL